VSFQHRLQLLLRGPLRPVVRFFMYFFYNTHWVDGSAGRVHVGRRVGLSNTICNVSSGSIFIGDNCAFGYNVMLLTGRHRFVGGVRASLSSSRGGWGGDDDEVPTSGYDIRIGSGCWIASGAMISGNVTIGENVIVAANAVVTSDLPDFAIAAGIPARIVGDTRKMGAVRDSIRDL
jgi:acetyltransferase-like isoleucine patch superfamily enzyme